MTQRRAKRVTVPLRTANKAEAWELFQEHQREARLQARGLADPHKNEKQRPLTEHVEDWRYYLEHNAGNTAQHVQQSANRLLRIITDRGMQTWNDLTADAVTQFLTSIAAADRRGRGRAVEGHGRPTCGWLGSSPNGW